MRTNGLIYYKKILFLQNMIFLHTDTPINLLVRKTPQDACMFENFRPYKPKNRPAVYPHISRFGAAHFPIFVRMCTLFLANWLFGLMALTKAAVCQHPHISETSLKGTDRNGRRTPSWRGRPSPGVHADTSPAALCATFGAFDPSLSSPESPPTSVPGYAPALFNLLSFMDA